MPRTDLDPRTALRAWVRAKAAADAAPADAAPAGDDLDGDDLDGVALFQRRLLTSLHLPELILLIERLRGAPVDVGSMGAEHVASIDAIVAEFFAAADSG
jgi:hypothetical protein